MVNKICIERARQTASQSNKVDGILNEIYALIYSESKKGRTYCYYLDPGNFWSYDSKIYIQVTSLLKEDGYNAYVREDPSFNSMNRHCIYVTWDQNDSTRR